MRRLDYTLELESEGYTVMSYSGFNGSPKADSCLPIRMTVLDCRNKAVETDIVNMAMIPHNIDLVSKDFHQHYVDILHGVNADWILAQFQVRGRGLKLEFLNLFTEETEELDLVLNLTQSDLALRGNLSRLYLQFNVPHQNGVPDTVYKVLMDYGTSVKGDSPYSTIIICEYEQHAQRTLMFENDPRYESMDDIPIRASITEYVDL
ncbi:hypothetical protein [Phocaeicola sartorii]|uniref:hypothetical protein n=1 Tax=Phocaeicola sartorii TaxID=671267 RepID=UPI002594F4B6|nr:hypothetical protein [Phocaeicola sartorii]